MKVYDYVKFAKDLAFTIERRVISQYRDNLGNDPRRAMEHGDSKSVRIPIPWILWSEIDAEIRKERDLILTMTFDTFGVKSHFSPDDFEITINISPDSKAIDEEKIKKRIRLVVAKLIKEVITRHEKYESPIVTLATLKKNQAKFKKEFLKRMIKVYLEAISIVKNSSEDKIAEMKKPLVREVEIPWQLWPEMQYSKRANRGIIHIVFNRNTKQPSDKDIATYYSSEPRGRVIPVISLNLENIFEAGRPSEIKKSLEESVDHYSKLFILHYQEELKKTRK